MRDTSSVDPRPVGQEFSGAVFGQKAARAQGPTAATWEPAIAALAGVVLLHERLTATQWMAIVAIVAASVGG